MLCTSPHYVRNGIVGRIAQQLDERLVAPYTGVQPHVQAVQLDEAVALAVEHDVNCIIGLGGGSALGMAKAVIRELEARLSGKSIAETAGTNLGELIPLIAIPTTYAGSEMTSVYGVTRREADGLLSKKVVRDSRIAPRVIIYDPELTFDLPQELTATTAINALAHCIEAIYSRTRNPISTSAALQGVRYIHSFLFRCITNGNDLEARTGLMIGAHLGGVALSTVEMGLHHGICHVLGGSANVPHGVANCIVLPHVMRFNLDVYAAELSLVAGAMGVSSNDTVQEIAKKGIDRIYELISNLGVPQRLREVDVPEATLPLLAEAMRKNHTVNSNPKLFQNDKEALDFLRVIW